jgi:uncharacterized protein YndB with AHSA1/START domain
MTTFETSRKLPAPPESIFSAFSDGGRLARWWGPDGFTNTFGEFEFRPGGRWAFVMHGPEGRGYPNESVFQTIEPPGRIVIRHESEPKFTLSVRIEGDAEGSTVHWRQEFDSDKVAASLAHIVGPANEQNLGRLAAEVARG